MIEVTAIAIRGPSALWVALLIAFLLGFAISSIVHHIRSRRRCLSCDALLRASTTDQE